MSEKAENVPQGSLAQQVFGPQAPVYAASRVHMSDDSLEALERLAAPGAYQWAVDLGTGAGFTAFAVARYSRRVLATDLTRPMLEQARRIGQERGLDTLGVAQNVAEALPFADQSLDLVTSRVAAHHFSDFERALDEAQRALKVGGVLLMADSVAPEDDAVAGWMNDIELRRDFSHVKNRKVSEIEALLAARRLVITGREYTRIRLQFNEWVARTRVPAPEAAALRRDFLNAPAGAREAFEIQPDDEDISFSWPCLVFRAMRE